MADIPSPSEIADIGRNTFKTAIDPDGTGAVNVRPGSRNDTALSPMTAIGNRLSMYVLDRVSAGRRATATGDDLDIIAADIYGETRKEASKTTGIIRLTRAGSSSTNIPKGSRFAVPAAQNQPAIVFVATDDVSSSTTSATVPVEADAAGVASNISAATKITSILDPLPDSTWSIDTSYMGSNPTLFIFSGGADLETDAELRARLEQISPQAERQRGTKAAIFAGALRVPGISYATIVEPLDGTVLVYAGDVGYQLSDAVKTALGVELDNWRSFGVPTLTRRYSVQNVTVTAVVYMARPLVNYDLSAIRTEIVQAIKDYFASRPQPDEYYTEAIIAAVFRGHDEIQHVTMSAPAANVQRPADTGYGSVTALNRYTVEDGTINLTFQPPATV